MIQPFHLCRCFRTSAFLIVAFSTQAAFASTIFVDDAQNLYRYVVASTAPGTVNSSGSVASQSTLATAMAIDTFSAYPVLVLQGTSINAYSFNGAASPTPFLSGLSNPKGLTVDALGDVYTSQGGVIDEYGSTGSFITSFGSGPTVGSLLADSQGDVYEASAGSTGSITEFLAGGGTQTIASGLNGVNLFGMAFDSVGDLYVSYYNRSSAGGGIFQITPSGTVNPFYSSSSLYPTDLAYDSLTGNLYLTYLNSFNGNSGGVDIFLGSGSGSPSSSAGTFASGLYKPMAIAIFTPEPGSMLLLATGFGLLALSLRRRTMDTTRNTEN